MCSRFVRIGEGSDVKLYPFSNDSFNIYRPLIKSVGKYNEDIPRLGHYEALRRSDYVSLL